MSLVSTASQEDLNKALQVAAVVGQEYSLEDILMVMRNHESSNLDDIVMTFLSDINLQDWRIKDTVFQTENKGEAKDHSNPNSNPNLSSNLPVDDGDDDLASSAEKDISNIFEDPITFETMVNAVQTICGHSFSEISVRDWVEQHHSCPTCNHPLNLNDIVPNYGMRQAILAFSKYDLHHVSKKGSKPSSPSVSGDHPHPDDNIDHDIDINHNENEENNKENIKVNNKENNKEKESNKDKEIIEDKVEKKEEEEEEMFAGFSLTDSTKMIPLIKEKLNNFNNDDATDELRSSMITELSLIKSKLEEHIDHHIVYNYESEEISDLMDTFEQVESFQTSLLPPDERAKKEENNNSIGAVDIRSSSLLPHPLSSSNESVENKSENKSDEIVQSPPSSNILSLSSNEKKEEEEEEGEMRKSNRGIGLPANFNFIDNDLDNDLGNGKNNNNNNEEEDSKYLQGPFHISKEDLSSARQILSIIHGKYTLDDVILIMRHHHSTKALDIIEIFLGGPNMEEWRAKDKELLRSSAAKRDCPLCFDEFPITDMFTLDCPSTHRFCYECIQRMVEISINDGALPYCPHIEMVGGVKKTCGYMISELEVMQICGKSDAFEKYKKILLRIGLMSLQGCMGCPTPGCENWLVVDDDGMRVHCHCDACGKSFCSMCREEYHYHSSCDEFRQMKVKWIQWNAQDRSAVQKDVIDLAIIKRKEDIARRMEEFLADEKWKEDNLRLCPTCQNPIEKVSGCDSMICGQNYHGGDQQKGCGSSFNWQTAARYKSSHNREHLSALADDLKIDKDDLDRVKADHGDHILCDMCQKKIIGFRFLCINCPCYNICEDCEVSLDHNPSHTFKIMVKPEGLEDNAIKVELSPLPVQPPSPLPVDNNNNNNNVVINIAPAVPAVNTPPRLTPLPININVGHQTNWVPPPPAAKAKKLDRLKQWITRKKK